MQKRPYYNRMDRDLAEILADRIDAEGLVETPSVARCIELIRQALREQHGDDVPALGTGRAARVVDAWLPVVRCERAVEAAKWGSQEALEHAQAAEQAALRRAMYRTQTRLQEEKERSETRRRIAKNLAPQMEHFLQVDVRSLLMAAAYAGRDSGRRTDEIADELLAEFNEHRFRMPPSKPGRRPRPKPVDQLPAALPVDQSPSAVPVDQLLAAVPDDRYTVYDDPRQVSLLVDQKDSDAVDGFLPPS